MKPSEALQQHRAEIRQIVARHEATNPRLFGSVIHGNDRENSDLDLLVDPVAGKTTLVSLVRIKREIEALLGVRADVLTPMAIHERYRSTVLREAVPL
jgi:predicted nucleotidyltransferase